MATDVNDNKSGSRTSIANERLALYLRLLGIREDVAIEETLRDLITDAELLKAAATGEEATRQAIEELIVQARNRTAHIFQKALPAAPPSCAGLTAWRLRRLLRTDPEVFQRTRTTPQFVAEALRDLHPSTPAETRALPMNVQELEPYMWYARLRLWTKRGRRLLSRRIRESGLKAATAEGRS